MTQTYLNIIKRAYETVATRRYLRRTGTLVYATLVNMKITMSERRIRSEQTVR